MSAGTWSSRRSFWYSLRLPPRETSTGSVLGRISPTKLARSREPSARTVISALAGSVLGLARISGIKTSQRA
nr:MAG TPA: hypothetical protein [Caudoviricetes sp.]